MFRTLTQLGNVSSCPVGGIVTAANGREDGILDTLRIRDDFITNRETYAWWKANLRVGAS